MASYSDEIVLCWLKKQRHEGLRFAKRISWSYGCDTVSNHFKPDRAGSKGSAKTIGKTGRIWTRIFPDRPYTKKAAEVPMGSGKGEPEGFCFETYAGRMLFEVDGVTPEVAKEAFRKANSKLPVKTKVVSR